MNWFLVSIVLAAFVSGLASGVVVGYWDAENRCEAFSEYTRSRKDIVFSGDNLNFSNLSIEVLFNDSGSLRTE